MSGEYVSYSIRPNKTVERLLFVELLSRLDRALPDPIHQYCYIGLGGAFLDDFKLMYAEFGMRHMVSIEADPDVHRRQVFNRPFGHIQCLNITTGELVDRLASYVPDTHRLFWLDYAEAGAEALRRQLQEIATLLPKLSAFDIVKVTLNANPHTLGDEADAFDETRHQTYKRKLKGEELQEHRFGVFRAHLDDLLPGEVDGQPISANLLKRSGFPRLVIAILAHAAYRAQQGMGELRLQPMTAYSYADGPHQMLTVTAILLHKEDNGFMKSSRLNRWNLAQPTWDKPPILIRVPFMSVKERHRVDSLLHLGGGRTIQRRLNILLQETEDESAAALADYKKFNRQYSHFIRSLP